MSQASFLFLLIKIRVIIAITSAAAMPPIMYQATGAVKAALKADWPPEQGKPLGLPELLPAG